MNDPNLEWYTDENGKRVTRPRGSSSGTPAAAQHEKGLAEEAGVGQAVDLDFPQESDYPDLAGFARAARLTSDRKRYRDDEMFRREVQARKRQRRQTEQALRDRLKGGGK